MRADLSSSRWIRPLTVVPMVLLCAAAACAGGRIVSAPEGFVRRIGASWRHGETLGATDLVHDEARGDLWIVAGAVHGGPDDGEIAVWAVTPRSALDASGGGDVVAVNDVARETNALGLNSGPSSSVLEHDAAVTTAITDLQASLASHVGGG